MTTIGVALGCIAANFAFQAYTNRDWECATERSFFQAIAIVALTAANMIAHV